MIKGKEIKAISILLIMLAMMMHNSFPHIHHQHELNNVVFSTGNSHHHHDHGHEEHEDNETDQPGENEHASLIDFLITGHAHSSHSQQLTPVTVKANKESKVLICSCFLPESLFQSTFSNGREDPDRYDFSDQIQYDNPNLLSNSLRGPPFLG